MIDVRNVTKRFGRVTALDRVSLHVGRGEMMLLLGSNGAGKSTLLRCILGITGYEGEIRVDGLDPLVDGKEVRRRIGYMPQSEGLHDDLTVSETLRFYCELRNTGLDRAREALDGVRLTGSLDARVGDLSGGMAQKLAFVIAVLADPPVLLLDEPTSSLDGWSREFLLSRLAELKDRGKTILLSTHSRRSPLRMANRAVTLHEGVVGGESGDWEEDFDVGAPKGEAV
jgi:ABC-type multidrug transport system ATPase subunit